jgi:pyrroloquinoline quinone (PQQ) biosynthesis protein C
MTRHSNKAEHDPVLAHRFMHHPALRPSGKLTDQAPGLMSPDDYIADLTRMMERERDASTGAFYRALFDGKVTPEGARIWLQQWYYEARAFIPLVAQVVANCDYYYDVRQMLGENLYEELGELVPSREHPQILKKMGVALGLTEEEIEFTEPIPEVLVFTEYQKHIVRNGNIVEAIAAGPFYHEFSIPDRYPKIGAALKKYFGVSHEALEFLWIHAGDPTVANDYGGDVEHTKEAVNALKKYAVTEGLQNQGRLALWRSVQAGKIYNWGLYRAAVLDFDPEWRARMYG